MKLPFIGWHGVITIVAYALFILGSTLYLATRGVSRKNLSSFYLESPEKVFTVVSTLTILSFCVLVSCRPLPLIPVLG